jgi:Trk K+ transport system NAD-binding subunit
VKQIQLMLFHDRQEIRETLGGGELLRMRMPVGPHMVGKPATSFDVPGKILIAGVSRGGGGFLPTQESTLQAGDYLVVMLTKDGMDTLDEVFEPAAEHH